MKIRTVLAVSCLLSALACQQNPPPGEQPAKPAAPAVAPTASPTPQEPVVGDAATEALLAEMKQQFDAEHIVFDTKAMTVTIPVVVNEPRDLLEYLLIQRKGKRHESLFVTDTKPSVLNAALLLLGLEPGQNATYREKDPLPSMAEIEAGVDPLVVTPPQGTKFWMTVRWPGPDGKPVERCVEELFVDLTTQEPVADCEWVYLGGRMARLYKDDPEVYVADYEGNLVSICYLVPDNHLGTMSHERARDDQNWWLSKHVPEAETKAEFVFHRNEPVMHVQWRERIAMKKAAEKAGAAEQPEGPKDEPPQPAGEK